MSKVEYKNMSETTVISHTRDDIIKENINKNVDRNNNYKNIPRPSDSEFQEKLSAINKSIDALKYKLRGFKDQIASATSGKEEFIRSKEAIRKRLDDNQALVEKLEVERKEIIEKIEKTQNDGKIAKSNVMNLKKTLGVSSKKEIMDKIKDIERNLMINTMTLKEEKKLIQNIAQLKAAETKVSKTQAIAEAAQEYEGKSLLPLKMQLDAKTAEIKKIRSQKKKDSDQFRALFAGRQITTEPLKEIFKAKQALLKQLDVEVAKKKEIYDEYNNKIQEWKNMQRQLRASRIEKIKLDKEKKAMEHQKSLLSKQLEGMEETPLEAEIHLRVQTIQYVRKLIEERDARANEENEHDSHSKNNLAIAIAGESHALLPKNQRGTEFFYAPKKISSKKISNIKKIGKPHCFKHDIGTLSYFEQCGVTAPVGDEDLDSCLDQLLENHELIKKQQIEEMGKFTKQKQDLERQLVDLESKEALLNGKTDTTPIEDSNENMDTTHTSDGTISESVKI